MNLSKGVTEPEKTLEHYVVTPQWAACVLKNDGSLKTDSDSLPNHLQLVLKNLAVPDGDIDRADRVRTARAVRKLLADCEGKEPSALVGAIASATTETSETAMGRSLKSSGSILTCLGNTKWELFQAVSQLGDQRKTQADLLLEDVCTAVCIDELALAGGLDSKLSDAETRAITLLTPPPKDEGGRMKHLRLITSTQLKSPTLRRLHSVEQPGD